MQPDFEALVEEVAYWWLDSVPDWIRCMDSDLLRDLPHAAEKRKWLRKAKTESIRRTIQERVDGIAEAHDDEDDLLIDILMNAFPEDLKLYGDKLTSAQRQMWIDKAALAACGRSNEIAAKEPVVYFISADDDLVKIGYTTSLNSRLRSLRTAHPKELRILFVIPGSRDDEQELHRRFADFCVGREWFKRCDAINDYITDQLTMRVYTVARIEPRGDL
jgi:hypothetical protein